MPNRSHSFPFAVILAAAIVGASAAPAVDVVAPARERQLPVLPDGTLLLCGGWNGSAALTSSYRYDGEIDVWTPVAPLSIGREAYSATPLLDGRVLVIGGYTGSGMTATAALFDPATSTWSPAASRAAATCRQPALRLTDGKVLVIGGALDLTQNPAANVEVYDPATDSWTAKAPMISPRTDCTAVFLADGRVLCAGGYLPGGARVATADIYDPVADAWTALPPMVKGRHLHTAARLPNGKVMEICGTDGAVSLTSTEVFDPGTSTWSAGPSTSAGWADHRMVETWNHRLLLTGLVAGELYDPTTDAWSKPASATFARIRGIHAAAILPDGRVVVVGGNYGAELGDADVVGQSISFAPIPDHAPGDSPIALTASSSAGLPVSFSLLRGPATLSGSTLTLTGGVGVVVVRAEQSGDATWFPASRTRSFTVAPSGGTGSGTGGTGTGGSSTAGAPGRLPASGETKNFFCGLGGDLSLIAAVVFAVARRSARRGNHGSHQ
jgi:hypothetical protein